MSKRPYTVVMQCPFSNVKEEVHFYEELFDGQMYLKFYGCDNGWCACDECEACHNNAYNEIINRK